MTRRLILFVALALLSLSAFADKVEDRDVLLTPDGTMYALVTERVPSVGRILKLTVQRPNSEPETTVVPATAEGGFHNEPTLAYDPDNQTLFLFWQTLPAPMTSSLMFCTYQNGTWGTPASFAEGAFRLQWNLRIGITRYVDDEDQNGSITRRRASIVHAVWWEENGNGEVARYAMISLDGGKALVADVRDLISFVENPKTATKVLDENYNRDFLRQPTVLEQPNADVVDVVFADMNTANFYRVEVRPKKKEGVLRPPIGRTRGVGSAPDKALASNTRLNVLPGRPGTRSLIFYVETENHIEYFVFDGSSWSEMHSIAFTETFTRDISVRAVQKMLTAE
jgi:hypothetical protein